MAAGAAALTLLVFEGAARLLGYSPERPVTPTFSWAGGELFRMKPGSVWHMAGSGDEVRVNAFGVRGPEIGPKDSKLRVLCLGDSVTFGYDVGEHATYVSKLETELSRALKRPVEALNFAVAGWSTRQERLMYERFGKSLDPDLVVVGVVLNDLTELRSGVRETGSDTALRAMALTSSLAQKSALIAMSKDLYTRAFDPVGREIGSVMELARAGDSRAVAHTLDLQNEELGRLVDAVYLTGRPLAVVLFPYKFQLRTPQHNAPQESMKAFLDNAGVPVLDLLPVFLERDSGDLFMDAVHLSEQGHLFTARTVSDWLVAEELVQ